MSLSEQSLALGVDIGGTNTVYGLVDRRGNIVYQSSMRTKGHKNAVDYIDALCARLIPIIERHGREHIAGCGMGAPNGNFYTGEVAYAANLHWDGVVPLAAMVQERIGIKTTITNDANAATLGEMMYGAAKGMKDFVLITLGTGLGSGFVANGQLIYGHDGFAGELGHVTAVRDGRSCGCGRNGCLETYVSATGVARTAELWLGESDEPTALRSNKGHIHSKMVHDAAEQGDAFALKIFDYTARLLGQSIADAAHITSPQAFIFFGGLARAGALLLQPTKNYMEENLLRMYKGKIQVLSSALPQADAAILGASALVW